MCAQRSQRRAPSGGKAERPAGAGVSSERPAGAEVSAQLGQNTAGPLLHIIPRTPRNEGGRDGRVEGWRVLGVEIGFRV